MKKLILITFIFFLCACTSVQPSLVQREKFLNYINGKYYLIPNGAKGKPLTKKDAKVLNRLTRGLLRCKKNDLFVMSSNSAKKFQELINNYNSKLTPKEYKKELRNPGFISKPNSKEYQEFLYFIQQKINEGDLGCIPPMTQNQLIQYKLYLQNKLIDQQIKIKMLEARYKQQQRLNNMIHSFSRVSMPNIYVPRMSIYAPKMSFPTMNRFSSTRKIFNLSSGHFMPDGIGGFYTPNGNHIMSDGGGGFFMPNGNHIMPNGVGGFFMPNGNNLLPDGGGGFFTSSGDHIMPDGGGGFYMPNGKHLIPDGGGGFFVY